MWTVWIIVGALVLAGAVAAFIFLRRRRAERDRIVGIAMLRTVPLSLEPVLIKQIARQVYKKDFELLELSEEVGSDVTTLVAEDFPFPLVIINRDRPYIEADEIEATIARSGSPETRQALAEHTSWVSVDIFKPPSVSLDRSMRFLTYQMLALMARELLDEHCVMIYLPGENRLLPASRETLQRLIECDESILESDPQELNSPLFMVNKDDPEIVKAKRWAQNELPTFVQACRTRLDEGRPMCKVGLPLECEDEAELECLWIEVTGLLEQAAGPVFRGRIANVPVRPDLPRKGETIEVPAARVMDWAFLDAKGKLRGLYLDTVLRKRQPG